jgi:hypothetical protein
MTMTYASLLDNIQDYANRNDQDFIEAMPGFVYLTNTSLCTLIEGLGEEMIVTSTFIPGVPAYPKAANWRTPITMNYGTETGFNEQTQMFPRTYEYCISYAPDATALAPPLYYSDYGFNYFWVAPTPDLAYPFKYSYLQMPEALTIGNQTNWFTNYAPDVLLAGCMYEAMLFLKNYDEAARWEMKRDKGVSLINSQNKRRYQDRTSNREAD